MSAELAPGVLVKSREPPTALTFGARRAQVIFEEEPLLPNRDAETRLAVGGASWRRLRLVSGSAYATLGRGRRHAARIRGVGLPR